MDGWTEYISAHSIHIPSHLSAGVWGIFAKRSSLCLFDIFVDTKFFSLPSTHILSLLFFCFVSRLVLDHVRGAYV